MAKKDLYGSRQMTDMSYLLDPDMNEAGATTEIVKEKKKEAEMIPINALISFKNHPFHIDTEGEDFEQLVESIKENGLIYPILIRPVADQFEIIAGHRRVAACKAAGLTELPAIVRPLDDYEATILMVHSNFYRNKILASEKAKAYRMCMEAEKHRGRKGGDTASEIGMNQDSKRQVYRFIRLSYLTDDILELIDTGKMAMNVGVELSYLNEATQKTLLTIMEEQLLMPSLADAEILHKMCAEEGGLSHERLLALLIKPVISKVPSKIAFKTKDLRGYFAEDTAPEEMSNVIIQLLERYQRGEFDEILK